MTEHSIDSINESNPYPAAVEGIRQIFSTHFKTPALSR